MKGGLAKFDTDHNGRVDGEDPDHDGLANVKGLDENQVFGGTAGGDDDIQPFGV